MSASESLVLLHASHERGFDGHSYYRVTQWHLDRASRVDACEYHNEHGKEHEEQLRHLSDDFAEYRTTLAEDGETRLCDVCWAQMQQGDA